MSETENENKFCNCHPLLCDGSRSIYECRRRILEDAGWSHHDRAQVIEECAAKIPEFYKAWWAQSGSDDSELCDEFIAKSIRALKGETWQT